jgi:hypothetical protein
MVTGTQMQTAWALWIRDLAEMPETHLAEIKHREGELKCWCPEPLPHVSLLHATIHGKNKQTASPTPQLSVTPLGLHPAGLPGFRCSLVYQASAPWTCRPAGPLLTGLPGICPTRLLLHGPARVPLTGPPQEDSNTIWRCPQTCLGDADKQDWTLKE